MRNQSFKKILIAGDHGDFTRAVWRGALRFIQTRPEWQLYTAGALMGSPHRTTLDKFEGDGVLYLGSELEGNTIDIAEKRDIPIVFLVSSRQSVYHPAVMSDEKAIGEKAATFFLDRGFRNLAFYSTFHEHRYSKLRRDAFSERAKAGGALVEVYDIPFRKSGSDTEEVVEWLHSLARPCGVMGVQDGSAMQLLLLCREQGIRVPQELAILGVGNTEFMCESMHPTLSSIDMGADRTGYEACVVLEQLMNGVGDPKTEKTIPPRCIVERHSTRVDVLADPLISEARSLLRERLHENLTVEGLVEMLGVSRRNLEQRFQKALSKTPGRMIREIQMQRVEELLRETDLSMAEIARTAGFSSQSAFAAVFRRERDMTPGEYRRQNKNGN
ncbi:MAG: substrate-binding domain-containing protein [Candidatus Sumerlaeota bacterium]